MRLERIARRLFSEPVAINPAHHAGLVRAFEAIAKGHALDLGDLMPEPAAVEQVGRVAVIPIKGAISRELSQLEKSCGGCDLKDVRRDLDAALNNPDVAGIVLDIDSPGGSVPGVEETAAAVADARGIKPIIAHTSGMACSAAYWIASAASAIYATPSATVGSIGVYHFWLDPSRAMSAAGVDAELFKATGSPLKAAGLPGVPLSDEQRDSLQAKVDYLYGRFVSGVTASRKVDPSAMRGQTFFGAQAQAVGLIDSLAEIGQAIKDVETLAIK